MKVGDMVRHYGVGIIDRVEKDYFSHGLIVQLSRSGQDSLSALVLFENGNLEWIPDAGLGVIDENKD
jgi:hypothetical protein